MLIFSPGIASEQFRTKLDDLIGEGKRILLLGRPKEYSREHDAFVKAHSSWVSGAHDYLLSALRSSSLAGDFGDLAQTIEEEWEDSLIDALRKDIKYRLSKLERIRDEIDETFSAKDQSPASNNQENQYDILISWSKPISKRVAHAFYELLPTMIPNCKPWISTIDIRKGRPWFDELQKFLGNAKACVIFLTKENVRSPWLYYEAGAIGTKIGEGVIVCPYLVGISANMLSDGPLGQYQATVETKDDTSVRQVQFRSATRRSCIIGLGESIAGMF